MWFVVTMFCFAQLHSGSGKTFLFYGLLLLRECRRIVEKTKEKKGGDQSSDFLFSFVQNDIICAKVVLSLLTMGRYIDSKCKSVAALFIGLPCVWIKLNQAFCLLLILSRHNTMPLWQQAKAIFTCLFLPI